MLFSRISIEDNFDPVAIYKFYDLLSSEFSDMEIIWKSGIKNVSWGEDADSVKIKVNGKTLFIHNSTNIGYPYERINIGTTNKTQWFNQFELLSVFL